MAFEKMDEAAFDPIRPVSTGVVQDIARNTRHVQQICVRSFCYTPSMLMAPRLCSIQRSTLPFVWRLSPGVETLELEVIGDVVQADVMLGLWVRSASEVNRPLPEIARSETIVSPATGARTMLTFDVSSLSGWVIIHLYFHSHGGSTTQLLDKSGNPEGLVSHWGPTSIVFNEANLPAPGFTPLVEGIPQYALHMLRKFGTDPPGNSEELPPVAQVVRLQRAVGGSNTRARVYPPLPTFGTALNQPGVAQDFLYLTELGYLQLQSIEIRELAPRTLEPYRARYNVRQYPGALGFREVYREQDQVFQRQTRVYHCGPSNDPDLDFDTSSASKAYWGQLQDGEAPGNLLGGRMRWASPVGGNSSVIGYALATDYEDFEDETGNPWRRTGVTVRALLLAQDYEQENDWVYQTRVRCSDVITDAEVVEMDLGTYEQKSVPCYEDDGSHNAGDNRVGYLAGLRKPPEQDRRDPLLHSHRGLWPVGQWHQGRWVLTNDTFQDSTAGADTRQLQLRINSTSLNGETPSLDRRRFLHCISWYAGEAVGESAEQIGQEVP